jgi:hypothetical protein
MSCAPCAQSSCINLLGSVCVAAHWALLRTGAARPDKRDYQDVHSARWTGESNVMGAE